LAKDLLRLESGELRTPGGDLREEKKGAGRKRNPDESANGAIYTSLGIAPGKLIGLSPQGLKTRFIGPFPPFS
jgi:hypothetical protein